MIKSICFFSIGFAYNRLNRLKFYEKIFPKEVEIYLFTTNRHEEESIKTPQEKWIGLKRTKIIVSDYSPINTIIELKKICKKNKINRIMNLGAETGAFAIIPAIIGLKTKFLFGLYGDSLMQQKYKKEFRKKVEIFFKLFLYFFFSRFAEKLLFSACKSYSLASKIFLFPSKKIYYLPAPVDTNFFCPSNKETTRKELGFLQKKAVISLVGRVNFGKCADLFLEIVRKNTNILFILIGKWVSREIPKKQYKNLIYFRKKDSFKLKKIYSASDLVFCMHRDGTQTGIVACESLSCGIPIIHAKRIITPEDDSIIKCDYSVPDINNKIKEFLSLPKQQKQKISKSARRYAKKYLSDEVWKKEFIEFHLF